MPFCSLQNALRLILPICALLRMSFVGGAVLEVIPSMLLKHSNNAYQERYTSWEAVREMQSYNKQKRAREENKSTSTAKDNRKKNLTM